MYVHMHTNTAPTLAHLAYSYLPLLAHHLGRLLRGAWRRWALPVVQHCVHQALGSTLLTAAEWSHDSHMTQCSQSVHVYILFQLWAGYMRLARRVTRKVATTTAPVVVMNVLFAGDFTVHCTIPEAQHASTLYVRMGADIMLPCSKRESLIENRSASQHISTTCEELYDTTDCAAGNALQCTV